MPTVNQTIQDRALRHSALIERYKRSEVRRIIAFLNDELEPALLARLESRMARIARLQRDTGVHSTKRLQEMIKGIGEIIKKHTAEARGMATGGLHQLARAEAAWQAGELTSAIPVASIEAVLPSPAVLRAIATQSPVNGALVKDWFKNAGDALKREVTKAVNIGVASGETHAQIVKRVMGSRNLGFADGAMAKIRRDVETAVHTATQHVSALAREATFRENADIVDKVEWVATLDSNTCPVCGALDGKTFPVGEGRRPPAHPKCRCTPVPVTKSWRELGIDVDDLEPGMRASMGGEVPESTSFSQWLKGQDTDTVADVLGSKAAAKAYNAGDLQLSQFSTAWGKPLSLKQVLQKEGALGA